MGQPEAKEDRRATLEEVKPGGYAKLNLNDASRLFQSSGWSSKTCQISNFSKYSISSIMANYLASIFGTEQDKVFRAFSPL